jgi:hypothetical protein
MGLVESIEEIRKKPLSHRRRFAAVASIAVMTVITLVWFIFFFAGVARDFAPGSASPQESVAAPISAVGEKPARPF